MACCNPRLLETGSCTGWQPAVMAGLEHMSHAPRCCSHHRPFSAAPLLLTSTGLSHCLPSPATGRRPECGSVLLRTRTAADGDGKCEWQRIEEEGTGLVELLTLPVQKQHVCALHSWPVGSRCRMLRAERRAVCYLVPTVLDGYTAMRPIFPHFPCTPLNIVFCSITTSPWCPCGRRCGATWPPVWRVSG